MINLEELEQKAKAATPGPWDCGETSDFGFNYIVSNDDAIAPCFCMKQHDASFIASMNPTTALALIRVARAAMEFFSEYNTIRDEIWVSTTLESELSQALGEIE